MTELDIKYNLDEAAKFLLKSRKLFCEFIIDQRVRGLQDLKYLTEFSCSFTEPSGHEEIKELEVYNFDGAGGVALSMYNTDEVCILMIVLFCILPRKLF